MATNVIASASKVIPEASNVIPEASNVIPAQAGIQCAHAFRRRLHNWVPACAGMTCFFIL